MWCVFRKYFEKEFNFVMILVGMYTKCSSLKMFDFVMILVRMYTKDLKMFLKSVGCEKNLFCKL